MSEQSQLRPGVFIDRDGTISEEVGYLNHVSRFRMFPSVPAAIRKLNDRGIPAIVVTNQSGVGRGYFPESLVQDVHEAMTAQLAAAGARLEAIYYCPHVSSELCACRKPSPGMLERAASEHALDLQRSFVVGDRFGDIELGHRVGARSILVRSGYGEGEILYHLSNWKVRPNFIADDLAQAVDWILEQLK